MHDLPVTLLHKTAVVAGNVSGFLKARLELQKISRQISQNWGDERRGGERWDADAAKHPRVTHSTFQVL